MDPAAQAPGAAGGHGRGPDGEQAPAPAIEPEELWRRVGEAGIRLLRIPTPFAVGRVNTYLLEDDPLTLIDSGPNSGKALDELERQLGSLGHAIEDLELIIVTHQHIDHMGLVEILARPLRRRGRGDRNPRPVPRQLLRGGRARRPHAAELMREHGIPDDVVDGAALGLEQLPRLGRPGRRHPASSATASRSSSRDRTLEVQLRPGHSPSDTLFWDADRGILLGADHLIGHISSNPLLVAPAGRLRRAPAGAAHLPGEPAPARASCRRRSSSRATASRSPTTRR